MCGRMTLTKSDFAELTRMLGVDPGEFSETYRPRFNIAPTDQHWIVRMKHEERELLPAGWGLVNSWAKDAKGGARQINCRAETALARPSFRDAFARRRCVVPADGFYEWVGEKQTRRPIWFHPRDDSLFLFAGLYEKWLNPQTSEWMRTFTVLTTSPNETVGRVHDRMPVILDPSVVDEWLYVPGSNAQAHADKLRKLLVASPESSMVATAVSARANSVANDDAECVAAWVGEEAEQRARCEAQRVKGPSYLASSPSPQCGEGNSLSEATSMRALRVL